MKKKIAIVGTGIAGMAAAYFLRNTFDICFYERNEYAGGHTNTITIKENNKNIYIDSGFMVFNHITYPNLTRFFRELDIKTMPTSMSFSVQHRPSGLEYNGAGINALFAQRKNIFNIKFWKLLSEISKFNKHCLEVLGNEKYIHYSVSEYANENGYSNEFLEKFLLPMSSAIWSTPLDVMLKFPIYTLVQFFHNHGFLGLNAHFQWYTPVSGSRLYRDKVISYFHEKVFLNNAVKKIIRENESIFILDSKGNKNPFDFIILASHADESLEMLDTPSPLEKELLNSFTYQKNITKIHTDDSVMPKTKKAWASWNYRIDRDEQNNLKTTTIYYMNNLQNVSKMKNYFVSINDHGLVDPKYVLWERVYTHPVYNVNSQKAQKSLHKLNENGRLFFCGSYFKYGFHEDAFNSGLNVARKILGEKIWN